MIVSRLRVHPFGFFSDKEVVFTPGLNVVAGPNEAGKSTLFSAIRSSLLRTKLRKPEFDKLIGRHLPAGGGDVARLELEFVTGEGRWVLKRQWGAGARSELLLPSGGTLVDDEAIRQKLQAALPVKQGTFWKVLMTGQQELSRTMESLRGDGAVSDLADLLRRTVLETAGIPVDEFRALLAMHVSQSFQHWDDRHQGPEAGRGIANPWKKEVGAILAAWYAREEIRLQHERALVYEAALDEVNGRLRAAEQASAAADSFLSVNRKSEQDARNRRTLEALFTAAELEQKELHAASREWPVAENRAREIQQRLGELEDLQAPLEEEARTARAEEEGRALRDRHQRVARRRAQLEEARRQASLARPMARKDLEEIRRAARTADALTAGVEAGKLSMTVAALSDADLVVQEDEGTEERRRIARGEKVSLRAGGRIRLVSRDMEIEVRSGDAGALAASRREAAARKALAELLARHAVGSLEDAEELARVAEAHAAAIHAAEINLREELGGLSEEELSARVLVLGPARTVRPLADVTADLGRLEADTSALRREQKTIAAQLASWEGRYAKIDAVVDRLADARRRGQDIARQLAESAPLPPGFMDPEAFLLACEKARDESKKRWDERAGCADEKRDLEKHGPDQSSEELADQLAAAEVAFQAALRRGRALKRITAVTDELLGRSDAAIFDGMRAALEPLIGEMSRGRHAGVALEGSLPRGLTDVRGSVLGWELLSGGTRDMLALALRLAMASFFLQGADGFLMLDDPLAEMDPQRQEAAAAILRSFARDKQLIVFTCHPDQAEMMGGNLICL